MTTRRVDLPGGRCLYLAVPYSGPRAWLLLLLGGLRAKAMSRKYSAIRNNGREPSAFWLWLFRASNRAVLAVAPKEGTL